MSEQTLIKVDNAKLEKNSLIPFWSFQKPVNHRFSVDVLKQFRKIHRKTLKLCSKIIIAFDFFRLNLAIFFRTGFLFTLKENFTVTVDITITKLTFD